MRRTCCIILSPNIWCNNSRADTRCLAVTPEVLHSIALNDDPQGIGAVVRQKWSALNSIDPRNDLCWIVLQNVQSPGNLGTILRTSEAIGGAGVILLGDSIDAYDPGTVRASMAAMFRQRFVRTRCLNF
jgi:TrmH family RNA methyltransferase